MEKLIVESENLEERVCVVHRILEIMVVLQEYNNFNGVLALTSVLNSAAVHRIVAKIKDKFPNSLLKSLDEASLLVQGHFKVYWEKLRSINPPCVPFFGQYQTNILFLEEGNPDFLTINTNLINFTKRRKVAEIISEIQQYQNQPYCLHENAEIRAFLESLDPFSGNKSRKPRPPASKSTLCTCLEIRLFLLYHNFIFKAWTIRKLWTTCGKNHLNSNLEERPQPLKSDPRLNVDGRDSI
jgi:hypothetical protein